MNSASATLYGLGIGPGDPGLITVKARDILQRAAVIAYPAPEGGESLVRTIAAPHVPAGRIEVEIVTPMCVERYPAQEVYDRYAGILAGHLEAGRDVALLCEGDPFLYGSFMYLFERLRHRFAVEVVPGVSSLAACAAAAGRPLVSRDEALIVLAATLPEPELEAKLALADAAAILKIGRHLPKVRRVLARLGLDEEAMYVERATMANVHVCPLCDLGDRPAPYFSMILCKRRNALDVPSPEHVPAGVVLLALSPRGLALARRLQARLPGASVHGLAARAEPADVGFTETSRHLQELFAAGRPIVGLCAAGILIRSLAPMLADKRREPPVVAVAEDGRIAVPLLGGHHGANRLARAIAAITAGVAGVTTGGDVAFGLALDEPPAGWRVANPDAAKAITADLLAGRPVALAHEAGDTAWLTASGAPFAASGERTIRVTDRRVEKPATGTLVLHPPILAVGVGCERGCEAGELIALIRSTLAGAALAEAAVALIASIDLKADEDAVHACASALDVPARFFTVGELLAETARLASPSERVFAEVGCYGVAEGAALAAAGADGALVVAKTRSPRATCAVARAAGNIDAMQVGRARGTLTIVGIGPGNADWRTPEADRALRAASDIVGYQLYLELIGDAVSERQRLHAPPMTQEEARARLALDLAAEGRRVCLVSSGDAGVFGLATLVFELLDREDRAEWRRLAITVAPGVSAMQAAAARIGAPLGHDFCAISLSDLLTPWPDVERRLRAAADGDFVIGLYNPVSQRRRSQIEVARDILLTRRPAATPVVLARNLGRPGETIRVITLGELTADHADMLTVVLIGSSQTRLATHGTRRFVYTPRGYAAKMGGAGE